MLRYSSITKALYDDRFGVRVLLDQYGPLLGMFIGKPRGKAQKAEDPAEKFTRLVEQAMSRGMSYLEAVRLIDSIDPTLRQRSNELTTLRREVEQNKRQASKAAWRAEASRRFKERRGVR
jgi:hypothetical protein